MNDHLSNLPSGIKPLYITDEPNSPVELYQGLIEISATDISFQEEAQIIFEWIPSLRIVASFTSDKTKWMDWSIRGIKLLVRILELDFVTDAVVSSVTYGDEFNVSLHLTPHEIDNKEHCSLLTFQIINFLDYFGKPISFPSISHAGRLELLTEDWQIILDKTPNCLDIMDQLQDTGGYGITHTGLIRKRDSSQYLIEEGLDLLDAVRWFCSFCKGRFIGIPFIRGTDIEGNRVYEHWIPAITSPCKHSHSWYPKTNTVDLASTFSSFLRLWSDPVWKDTLKFIIHWYINANDNSGANEGSLVMCQIALERLAWMFLVNEKKALTIDGFGRLIAENNFYLLFNQLGIPQEIPGDFYELIAYCSANNIDNLASCIVRIRNSIVHPPKNIRNNPSRDVVYQTLKSSIWCLELSILSILKYEGHYSNRINMNHKWEEQYDLVPWA